MKNLLHEFRATYIRTSQNGLVVLIVILCIIVSNHTLPIFNYTVICAFTIALSISHVMRLM